MQMDDSTEFPSYIFQFTASFRQAEENRLRFFNGTWAQLRRSWRLAEDERRLIHFCILHFYKIIFEFKVFCDVLECRSPLSTYGKLLAPVNWISFD